MTERPQELCLVSESGAGAQYMWMFDTLPPAVRQRLRNSSINICLACLLQAAYDLDNGSQHAYLEIIHAFVTGAINDLRERNRRPSFVSAGEMFRGFYVPPNYPPSSFDDPSQFYTRSARDLAEGEFRMRMEQREWESRRGILEIDFGPVTSTWDLSVDWSEPVNQPFYRQLERKGKRR